MISRPAEIDTDDFIDFISLLLMDDPSVIEWVPLGKVWKGGDWVIIPGCTHLSWKQQNEEESLFPGKFTNVTLANVSIPYKDVKTVEERISVAIKNIFLQQQEDQPGIPENQLTFEEILKTTKEYEVL